MNVPFVKQGDCTTGVVVLRYIFAGSLLLGGLISTLGCGQTEPKNATTAATDSEIQAKTKNADKNLGMGQQTNQSETVASGNETASTKQEARKLVQREMEASEIAAFEALGAEYGGLVQVPGFELGGKITVFKEGAAGLDNAIPAFQFRARPASGLPNLPELDAKFGLSLVSTEFNDEDMQKMRNTTNIVALDLGFAKITDSGLLGLELLRNLEFLSVSSSNITDRGLRYLAGLSNLRHLELTHVPITDSGMSELEGFTQLESLKLLG